MTLGLVLGLAFGCVGDGEDVFEFRGSGSFFCCDESGECFHTPDGDCGPGELLSWCPITTTDETGATVCKEWE
jgi:hypothetical protein